MNGKIFPLPGKAHPKFVQAEKEHSRLAIQITAKAVGIFSYKEKELDRHKRFEVRELSREAEMDFRRTSENNSSVS